MAKRLVQFLFKHVRDVVSKSRLQIAAHKHTGGDVLQKMDRRQTICNFVIKTEPICQLSAGKDFSSLCHFWLLWSARFTAPLCCGSAQPCTISVPFSRTLCHGLKHRPSKRWIVLLALVRETLIFSQRPAFGFGPLKAILTYFGITSCVRTSVF